MTLVDRSHWQESLPWIDRPDADIERRLAGLGSSLSPALRRNLIAWRERGIVIFEQAVAPDLIDRFVADLAHLKDHHRDYELSVELAGKTKPIQDYRREELDSNRIKFNHMHTISGPACRLSLNREVCEFLTQVFDDAPCVLQSLTFIRGSQQPIHIDYPYVCAQTKLAHLAASWVALEDVDPRAGPLAYYPGSHVNGIAGFFDWGQGSILLRSDSARTPMEFAHHLWDRMQEAGIRPEIFCPRKGDVLIWHGALAHEGLPIKSPGLTRKSYVTHYTSLAGYPPGHMKPDALKTGAYYVENGGYIFDLPWLSNPRRLPSWDERR